MFQLIAIAIRMKKGRENFNSLLEIDEVYLKYNNKGEWYKKEALYDYLMEHPKTIKVGQVNGPYMIPAISVNGEKYVKSSPNDTKEYNLLRLPKE